MTRAIWVASVLVALTIAGCSGYGNDKTGDSADVAKAPAAVPNPEPVEPVVKGTVTYRERLALPADAER